LPIEIGQLNNLDYLTLGFNNLSTIPEELFFFLSDLKALDLQSNPFELMPIINRISIFELMAYFRSTKEYIRVIEVPKDLRTALQQYLDFFPDFIESTSKDKIQLDVIKTKNGLKLTTYETGSLKISEINKNISNYLNFVNNSIVTQNISDEFVILKLEAQITHFQEQIKRFEFENKYLRGHVDKFLDIQEGFSKKNSTIKIIQKVENKPSFVQTNEVNVFESPISNEFINLTAMLNGKLDIIKSELKNQDVEETHTIIELQKLLVKVEKAKNQGEVIKTGFWDRLKVVSEVLTNTSKLLEPNILDSAKLIIEKIFEISKNLPL